MPTAALIQMRVTTADPEANLARIEPLLADAASQGADLAVMPEMCTTGFPWDRLPELAAAHGPILDRLAGLARRHRLWISGSMPLPTDDPQRPANTAIVLSPAGDLTARYRKVHLFSLIQEDRHVSPGTGRTVFDAPWGKTGLSVCYDLRFPELFRAYALDGTLVQLLPSAWPHPRSEHWRTLIRARAIENQLFILAVNQVGAERLATGPVTYCGHSAVIDPWGNTLAEAGEEETVLIAAFDPADATRVRAKMTVLHDRRPTAYR